MAWTATGGNLKGPKGDPGTDGAKGDAGTSLHVANITVSSNSDVAVSALSPSAPMTVGDLISDTNGSLFTVTSIVNDTTVHVSNVIDGVSFRGPKGARGADGAHWKDVGTIQGPKGDKGEPGINGKDGTNGANGLGWTYGHGVPSSTGVPVGSLYLDLDTGNVYAFNA